MVSFKLGVLKPFFVETGYLRIIGLCGFMCHMAAVLKRKAAGKVKRSYVITTLTVSLKRPVEYSVTKHSLDCAI